VRDAGDAAGAGAFARHAGQTVRITEASVRDYAMIARIEFDHPLFRAVRRSEVLRLQQDPLLEAPRAPRNPRPLFAFLLGSTTTTRS
jgi:hypothetical protein